MIKARIRELERNDFDAENVRDGVTGSRIGARTVAHPEQVAGLVPDAIPGALEHEALRQRSYRVDASLGVKGAECGFEMRLFPPPLGVAESRQQSRTIEHDCAVGRKHQIRQVRHGRNERNGCAEITQGLMQGRPFLP